MGKSKKKKGKGKGGGDGGGGSEKKLGRRKQLQREKLQKEDNEKKVDAALAAGLKKLEEAGITEDSNLFAPIPPNEDCPICMVPLPVDEKEVKHQDCCGKLLCTTCIDASVEALDEVNAGRETKKQPPIPQSCAFCRKPYWKIEEEWLGRMMKLVDSNNAEATYNLAAYYAKGTDVEKDEQKAFNLTLRAVELGNKRAFNTLGIHYCKDEILRPDQQKYRICLEASARAGNFMAHRNLGRDEYHNGNDVLAIKHYHIAAGAGDKMSLDLIQGMHKEKRASRDDFLRAIRVYQNAKEEQTSDERTKWAEKKKKAKESSATTK